VPIGPSVNESATTFPGSHMHIPDNLIPLVAITCAIGGPFVFLTIGSIFWSIERISKNRGDAQLKALMIERGMSAAEIEAVLAAPVSKRKSRKAQIPQIPPEKPIMASNGRQAW
jgi:hypothetical protein